MSQDDLGDRVNAREIRADIRDFRGATTASFNALRQDFVDLHAHVDQRFGQVERGFAEMRGRLDATAGARSAVVTTLGS